MPDFAPNIAVPAQDAADNDTSGDVIGNKTDRAAGDSLAARLVVPATDSADNDYPANVIGSKLDRTYNGGNSIFAELHTLGDHAHHRSRVYPTLAAGVTLTSDAVAWTLGPIVEIMADTIAGDPFDAHFINIEDMDTNGVYELVLYYGAGDTEYARIRFARSAVKDTATELPIMSPVIAAANRIRGAIAHSAGGAATCDISIGYHEY